MVNNVNAVFYATIYHPIQAGSIDGTDITAHDNGVYRALLGSATGLYDPLRDPKAEGDPYCSLFVGRLSARTDEKSLHEAMLKFGRVKNLRLVRHIVTGASCGYAFVEFETEKDMRHAYEGAHLSKLDGASILVDYNRQQLMAGWIPRRLGGGLGGKKESGQLRFGGRDRPFRAPLRPIPHEELQKLGIPLPPEGRYLSRFQVPPPPQRKHSAISDYDGNRSISITESKRHRVHSTEEDDSGVKAKPSFDEAHGSEAHGEGRERDRQHRRRRDGQETLRDGPKSRRHGQESRRHGPESRSEGREPRSDAQESRRESRYEGLGFEPKRQQASKTYDRDADDKYDGGERAERKRRREYYSPAHSPAYRVDEDEDSRAQRHGRWDPQEDDNKGLSSGRRNRDVDYYHHKERFTQQGKKPDPEQSEDDDQSEHRSSTRESERKQHRHSDSKHRRRDQDEDIKPHRSSRKHNKHRERSAGENFDVEEKEKKRSDKHRERDI